MALAPEIIEVIRQREAEIERLRDHGLPPFGSPGYLAAFMASKSKRTAKFEEERLLWQEINRSVLPHLLTAYMAGSPLDRQEIRDLLNDNSKFAWGLGWAGREGPPAAKQTATADDLRRRLLLFTMKDGLKDWRDETVTLDDFSATAQRSGIDIEPLLIEAADLASNQPRGDRASTRATLLERVRKLRRQS